MSERRATLNPFDVTGIVAIIYTIGFLTLAGLLYFYPIPPTNKDALLYLFGILSGVELSIVAFYYGSTKNAESIQRSSEQRSARTESSLQEAIKAVPVVAAVAAGLPSSAPIAAEHVQVTGDNVEVTEKPAEAASLCPNCNAPQEPGVKFCNKCGEPQTKDVKPKEPDK